MTVDRIALAGAGAGLVSAAALPFLSLRPNRILEGLPVGAPAALGAGFFVLAGALAAAAVLAVLRRRREGLDAAGTLVSGAGLAALLPLAGAAADRLAGDSAVARVSAGPGLWLAAAGLGVALFSFSRRLQHRSPARLAAALAIPAAAAAAGLAGLLDDLSLVRELLSRRDTFTAELLRHLALAGGSAALGAAVGIPLGLAMHRRPRWRGLISVAVSSAQVVPTLSLLGLLIVPMAALGAAVPYLGRLGVRGVGWAPAFLVLFLYALLPIAGNTFAALGAVAPEALDAARGMGMSRRQAFLRVQAPLALPVILAGVRTAFTANMGNAILAALVGGGGLGTLVFLGLAQAAPDLILLGALSTSTLALAADRALALAFRLAVSRGLRSEAP